MKQQELRKLIREEIIKMIKSSLNEAIKFNPKKVAELVKSDKFLTHVYKYNIPGKSGFDLTDKVKLERLFDDYIVGDPTNTKKYNKL